MEEESKPAEPSSGTTSGPVAGTGNRGRQPIILLVLLVPVALLTALNSVGKMFGILSGTPVVSEEDPIFRFIMALFALVAAVAAVATGCGAVWASQQEKKKSSEGDSKGASDAAKMVQMLCYFGWIIFACLAITLLMSFTGS